jgi:hypothetical protein
MIALNAHYDGKVIVPDEPLALKPNQKLRVSIEPIEPMVVESHPSQANRIEFRDLIGVGLPLPENHTPRFTSNDDLWDKRK